MKKIIYLSVVFVILTGCATKTPPPPPKPKKTTTKQLYRKLASIRKTPSAPPISSQKKSAVKEFDTMLGDAKNYNQMILSKTQELIKKQERQAQRMKALKKKLAKEKAKNPKPHDTNTTKANNENNPLKYY